MFKGTSYFLYEGCCLYLIIMICFYLIASETQDHRNFVSFVMHLVP